jgi:ligand-binding sensor domain-containing protein
VATADGGSTALTARNAFTSFPHDPADPASLDQRPGHGAGRRSQRGLWVGTYEGLDYLDPLTGQFTHYTNQPENNRSLSDNRVLALFRDRAGALWIGTEEGGLNRFNALDGSFTRYT